MTEEALIIFVKNAEPGKVKTRLAKDLGDEKAMEIYLQLLQHTHRVTRQLPQDKYVFYSSYLPETDIFTTEHYLPKLQKGEDLGQRMSKAFAELFDLGYKKVAIIGSDCAELEPVHIEKAFECLEFRDYVIGPAQDGGYYLLGMKSFEPGIFENIEWSTDTVYQRTADHIRACGQDFHVLPPLTDVDTIKDLGSLKKYVNL